MEYHELKCEVIKDKAAFNRAHEEAEAAKISFASTPAMQSAPACARFLGKIGVMAAGLAAQAEADERVLPGLIASGYKIPLHKLNDALARTTLSLDQRFAVKTRLSAIGLI